MNVVKDFPPDKRGAALFGQIVENARKRLARVGSAP